jgi:hypothetical protein
MADRPSAVRLLHSPRIPHAAHLEASLDADPECGNRAVISNVGEPQSLSPCVPIVIAKDSPFAVLRTELLY